MAHLLCFPFRIPRLSAAEKADSDAGHKYNENWALFLNPGIGETGIDGQSYPYSGTFIVPGEAFWSEEA
jgi:hypothetical protein